MDLPTAFPAEAVAWLIGRSARTVVCLGGREIAQAAEDLGHDVASMPTIDAGLPFGERSVDVVLAAGGLPADLGAVAALLRPGGHLGVVTKSRDHRIPWARKLDLAIGAAPTPPELAAPLVGSTSFGFVDEHEFRFWESVNRESLTERLSEELARAPDREERVAAGLALYDDYGRGVDGMQLPWVARAWKATVVESFWGSPMSQDETGELPAVQAAEPDDDAMLLIDFR